MCGIFGVIAEKKISKKDFKNLALLSRERGKDSSGFLSYNKNYFIKKFNSDIKNNINSILKSIGSLAIGHSRLITNSTPDNQPILRDNIACIHNGIVVNYNELFQKYKLKKTLEIDTEILPVLIKYYLKKKINLNEVIDRILNDCEGIVNCAAIVPSLSKLILFSNNGSLYIGKKKKDYYFASEKYFLKKIKCENIKQIKKEIIDIPFCNKPIEAEEFNEKKRKDFVPKLTKNTDLEKLLIYKKHNLQRCSKCILPSTMPFIKFDNLGICNYCKNYENQNIIKYNLQESEFIFNKFRNLNKEVNCIVPLSGGRDSCFALHLAKKKFNLNPVAYTYDWGLVTDLARRNISRICSKLNVENIIFADDISKKRNYIKKNVTAWLRKPNLGMVNLFTAGDKHFFRHVRTVKKRMNLNLDLWGINPLEVTHFKSGFLGIPPNFELKGVYTSGLLKQFTYHKNRFNQMLKNPSYFNRSIFDNLYGEIFRSIFKKTHHYSIFDFHKWNEKEVDEILKYYNWEKSEDTNSTWRIGDGAAAFYNYIYYTIAGFTEHDTFRSNQIREGQLEREKALKLIEDENRPRYQNIFWFLDVINMNFRDVVTKINNTRRFY